MCLTLRAVAGALRDLGDGGTPLPLPYVAETMAQAFGIRRFGSQLQQPRRLFGR